MPTFEFFLDSRGLITKEFDIDVTATLPKVTVQVFDGDDAVDLTGAIVTFTLRDASGAAVVLDAAATLVDATNGIVEYQLKDADVDDVGFFFAQFKITVGSDFYLIPNDSVQRLRLRIGKEDLPAFSSIPASLPVHAGSHSPGGSDPVPSLHDNVAGEFAGVTEKTSPVVADLLLIEDSEDSDAKKKVQVGNLIASSAARIKTGTYTGDNTESQAITGVGFRPKYVRIWKQSLTQAQITVFETTTDIVDDNAAGAAVFINSANVKLLFNKIISLDADGFTVDDNGINDDPNIDGQVYNYLAIG